MLPLTPLVAYVPGGICHSCPVQPSGGTSLSHAQKYFTAPLLTKATFTSCNEFIKGKILNYILSCNRQRHLIIA